MPLQEHTFRGIFTLPAAPVRLARTFPIGRSATLLGMITFLPMLSQRFFAVFGPMMDMTIWTQRCAEAPKLFKMPTLGH